MVQTEKRFGIAAIKAGMDEKTARKYRRLSKLPSELKRQHAWRTRKDPFEEVWSGIESMLEINPGLEAKAIFEDLVRRNPGRFSSGRFTHKFLIIHHEHKLVIVFNIVGIKRFQTPFRVTYELTLQDLFFS